MLESLQESERYTTMATPPLSAVQAAREAAAAAAELVGDTSFTSTFPTGSEADKAILIVERQLQSFSRRLTRCETDVASARTLYQHALQGHEASLRSANSGEIEHSRVALATREQEMTQALERRNAASDAVSAAKQRLRQLVSAQDAFVTPIRRPVGVDGSAQVVTPPSLEDPKTTAVRALSKPSNIPEKPPPPGLSSSPPTAYHT